MKSKKSKPNTESQAKKPTEWKSNYFKNRSNAYKLPQKYVSDESWYLEVDQAIYDHFLSGKGTDAYQLKQLFIYFWVLANVLEGRCETLRKAKKDSDWWKEHLEWENERLEKEVEDLKHQLGQRKEFETPEQIENKTELDYVFVLYNKGLPLNTEESLLMIRHLCNKKNTYFAHFTNLEEEIVILKEKENRLNKVLTYEFNNSKVQKEGTYQNFKAVEWMALNDN